MEIAVSELIVRFMERLGIGHIFGMPGAHILPVYDKLHGSSVKSVLAKHEQGAAFMAGGYAESSGNIAACIATAGPGATNLVTGIANAYVNHLPILVITGETSTHIFGRGGLQESSGEGGSIEQIAMFKGITRYCRTVERTDYLGQVLSRTAKILRSNSPGPVLLSFPFNVQRELVDERVLDTIPEILESPHAVRAPSSQLDQLAQLLQDAGHPVIVAGYGCDRAGVRELIASFSESLNIPVATSLKGKGIVDENSPLALGTLGVTSNGRAYRYLVTRADLVLILGASFNERTSYLWDNVLLNGKKVVQVDSSHNQLEKVLLADIAIHADIGSVLSGLMKRQQSGEIRRKPTLTLEQDPNWEWKAGFGTSAGAQETLGLMEGFFARLASHFPQNTRIFDDNIIFAQNLLKVSHRNHYFPNGGISSLGHAIPAAIGAVFAKPSPTFAILGDGGFQMCCMELMTAVNYGIPLNVVLLNNASMGLIRKNQHQLYDRRFLDCDFLNPDYHHLARSFGIAHWRVENTDDLDLLFDSADLTNAINLIEILIDKDAFPGYLSNR